MELSAALLYMQGMPELITLRLPDVRQTASRVLCSVQRFEDEDALQPLQEPLSARIRQDRKRALCYAIFCMYQQAVHNVKAEAKIGCRMAHLLSEAPVRAEPHNPF